MGMLAPPPITIPSGPLTASPASINMHYNLTKYLIMAMTFEDILNLAIPAVTLLSSITTPQNQQIKSKILCLLNMAAMDELDDEDEYPAYTRHLLFSAFLFFFDVVLYSLLLSRMYERSV